MTARSLVNINQNPDLIHYPQWDYLSTEWPKLISKIPIILTIHDVIPLEFPDHYPRGIKGGFNLLLQKLALNRACAVITDSYASVKAIRTHLSVPHHKINLIYLAAAPHFKPITNKTTLENIKKKYSLPDKFVLYVGDINWNKNLPGLASACQRINIPLVIVGKHAAGINQMDLNHPELSHLKNIDPFIALGFLPDDDLVAVYNLATVYCQASFAEGFGLPVLEAMACGTPVVCTNTHSLPEICQKAAAYFDPYDINDIAKTITNILNNSSLRTVMKKQGLIQVAKYSWVNTARATLQVYKEVIQHL